jgi:hypothetical protein
MIKLIVRVLSQDNDFDEEIFNEIISEIDDLYENTNDLEGVSNLKALI